MLLSSLKINFYKTTAVPVPVVIMQMKFSLLMSVYDNQRSKSSDNNVTRKYLTAAKIDRRMLKVVRTIVPLRPAAGVIPKIPFTYSISAKRSFVIIFLLF